MHLMRAIVLSSLLAVVLTGCTDQDPLELSLRPVSGTYYLEQVEDGLYYLRDGRADDRAGGALDGTVERLAWTPRYILAQRRPLAGGAVDGWLLIDTERHTAVGPLTDEDVAARSALPRASEALTAAEAWHRLGRDRSPVLAVLAAIGLGAGLVGWRLRHRSADACSANAGDKRGDSGA
jgi:hypothetical protein